MFPPLTAFLGILPYLLFICSKLLPETSSVDFCKGFVTRLAKPVVARFGFILKSISDPQHLLVLPLSRNFLWKLYYLSPVFVVIFGGYLFLRYRRWRRFVALVDKIPGPPYHPLLGHAKIVLDLDKTQYKYGTYALIYQMLTGLYLIYGKDRLCRMWLGFRPFIMLFTPEAVEVVLSSNTLTDKSVEYNFLKPWLGEGLVTSNKIKWKTRRKILTPAFHFKILQDFLPIINEQADVLVRKLSDLSQTGNNSAVEDVLPLITLCTLDTICETAMGIKVDSQGSHDSPYVRALHQVSELVLFRLTRPWLWPDFTFFSSKHGKRFKSCLKVMQDFTTDVIKERKKDWIQGNQHLLSSNTCGGGAAKRGGKDAEEDDERGMKGMEKEVSSSDSLYGGKKRLAFLDLLLQQHLVNNTLTLEDVREEVDTFMFAGHDTTAMAISWTLYLLGLHPEVQERVRQEIDALFDRIMPPPDADDADPEKIRIGAEMLKEMKYLEIVLKEVQRLYPTAPFVGRELTEDTLINGYLVPKGTTCGIFTFLLHRNEAIFPKPETFDPDRFLPENTNGRHPYAYVPFSAGPRNCVGQKFALMEQKIVVANVVRHFYLKSLDPRDKLVVVGEMVLRPRNGLRMEIKPRFAPPPPPPSTVGVKKTLGTTVTQMVVNRVIRRDSIDSRLF